MNWLKIETIMWDHIVYLMFLKWTIKRNVSWKNTPSLLEQDHQQNETKFNFLDCQLQFINAYHLIKLNDQEGHNENRQ